MIYAGSAVLLAAAAAYGYKRRRARRAAEAAGGEEEENGEDDDGLESELRLLGGVREQEGQLINPLYEAGNEAEAAAAEINPMLRSGGPIT